jgi:hypothetical protein
LLGLTAQTSCTAWSASTVVLNQATVGHYMETFSGKWFPRLFNGQGAMVLVTDGGCAHDLHPHIC